MYIPIFNPSFSNWMLLFFEKLVPKKKKVKEGKVMYIPIHNLSFQTRCGYFLGTRVEHCFGGEKSVKMSASANMMIKFSSVP